MLIYVYVYTHTHAVSMCLCVHFSLYTCVCVHTYTFIFFSCVVIVYSIHIGIVINFIILSIAGIIFNQYLDGTRGGTDLTLKFWTWNWAPPNEELRCFVCWEGKSAWIYMNNVAFCYRGVILKVSSRKKPMILLLCQDELRWLVVGFRGKEEFIVSYHRI